MLEHARLASQRKDPAIAQQEGGCQTGDSVIDETTLSLLQREHAKKKKTSVFLVFAIHDNGASSRNAKKVACDDVCHMFFISNGQDVLLSATAPSFHVVALGLKKRLLHT